MYCNSSDNIFISKMHSCHIIQVFHNAMGVEGCQISRKKHYEGDVRFNVIGVARVG